MVISSKYFNTMFSILYIRGASIILSEKFSTNRSILSSIDLSVKIPSTFKYLLNVNFFVRPCIRPVDLKAFSKSRQKTSSRPQLGTVMTRIVCVYDNQLMTQKDKMKPVCRLLLHN